MEFYVYYKEFLLFNIKYIYFDFFCFKSWEIKCKKKKKNGMYRGIYLLVYKMWFVKGWLFLGSWVSVINWFKEWFIFGFGNYCIKLVLLRSDLFLGVAFSSEIFFLDR